MKPERREEAYTWAEATHPAFGNMITAESEEWWRNIRCMLRELLAAPDVAESGGQNEQRTCHSDNGV